tara:strand:+ start:200 stop:457 length:258 start_codon:yes stop_codon:yes gene_type:complete
MKNNYEAEFKREALQLWRSSGRSAAKVAAELGFRAPLLYRWAPAERGSSKKGGSDPKGAGVVGLLEERITGNFFENFGAPGRFVV